MLTERNAAANEHRARSNSQLAFKDE